MGPWRIRFAGPVFRFGRNPALGLFLSRKIADVRLRAVACYYGNEPGTAAVQFGMKLRLGHSENMRTKALGFQFAQRPLDADPQRVGAADAPQRVRRHGAQNSNLGMVQR